MGPQTGRSAGQPAATCFTRQEGRAGERGGNGEGEEREREREREETEKENTETEETHERGFVLPQPRLPSKGVAACSPPWLVSLLTLVQPGMLTPSPRAAPSPTVLVMTMGMQRQHGLRHGDFDRYRCDYEPVPASVAGTRACKHPTRLDS